MTFENFLKKFQSIFRSYSKHNKQNQLRITSKKTKLFSEFVLKTYYFILTRLQLCTIIKLLHETVLVEKNKKNTGLNFYILNFIVINSFVDR